MKTLITIVLFVSIFVFGCTQVEPITSTSEVEPALIKHFGTPTRVDTLKSSYPRIGFYIYTYNKSNNSITFEKANRILGKAMNNIFYLKNTNGTVTSKMKFLNEKEKDYYISVFENKEKTEITIGVTYYAKE